MRYATPDLIALLNSSRELPRADCYTITLPTEEPISRLSEISLGNPSGQAFFYSSIDVPVQIGIVYFTANSVRIEGLRYRIKAGLEVDEQEITLYAKPTDVMNDVPVLEMIRRGGFDGARIRRERAFFDPATFPPAPGLPAFSTGGGIVLFSGRVSRVLAVGRTSARISVKSDLVLLETEMPRNLYSPSCTHTLFDTGCGIPAANFAEYGLVGAASTAQVINWGFAVLDYFDQGTIIFTTGANAGQTRTVRHSTGTQLLLTYPLIETPATNDEFTIYPGCDHTIATCVAKFNNKARFRGFPYVPLPETAT